MGRQNLVAGALLVAVLVGLPAGIYVYEAGQRHQRLYAEEVIEIHAYVAEAGGWVVHGGALRVGVAFTLRLIAEDVVHGFFIERLNVTGTLVPGHPMEVSVLATEPGSYTMYCTVSCGPGHNVMVGRLEAVAA